MGLLSIRQTISCNMKAVFIALAICAIAAAAASDITPGEEEFIAADAADLGRPAPGCKLKCKPRSCSVTIYQHCNYHGYRINLKPGSYNMHQLKHKGMKNDDISSIRFHGRCAAKLYEHWRFTGKSKVWRRSDSCFTRSHMKMESLLQISEETEETELVQSQWGRWRGRRRRVSWNDQMSSMKVFNHAGRTCHFDCSERNAKMKEKSKKAAIRRKKAAERAKKAAAREKADKAHKKKVAEKKRKADVRKEKAAKKRVEKARKYWARVRAAERRQKKAIAAWRKRVAARKEKRVKRAKAHEKRRKAAAKRRAAARKKAAARREKRMKASFKKKKKKLVKYCEVKVTGRVANRIKGMCRAYARFCRLYKRFGLHDDARRHCDNMKKFHKKLTRHSKKGKKKAKKGGKKKRVARYTGKGWCETFYTCKGGDKRNFHAWVKAKGYRMFKGACTHKAGTKKYGRRHKFWRGNHTFAQCRARCQRMGRRCQGITMPSKVKPMLVKMKAHKPRRHFRL